MTAQQMIRILTRSVAGLLVAGLLSYPADWAVWRMRVAISHSGGGMGTVAVTQFTVASLKGNKEEYYLDGTNVVDCSRSLFPQAGSGACWWLERHREVIVKY